ncbi:hypothetical protein [Robiginitalea sp. SC105]|uniref:hypothetical protein n=1 Tax=Robiginitalea sp. SC105 TaxID=2762332 RepID=UPI00163AC62B|nr:hypothetical protein [Robiginitalea sp. SC105]MBC2838163.1 hypothetical protein [Robiginitalea sp. SC105]
MRFLIKCFIILLTSVLFFNCSTENERSLTEEETKQIEKQTLSLAENWLNSWSGKVDPEKMMSNYHSDMKYVWRGVSPPGNYETSKAGAESMTTLDTYYELIMFNVDQTIVDRNNAVVFFHFDDRNGSPYGKGAVSLMMTRRDDEWKIIYVHESTIENHE